MFGFGLRAVARKPNPQNIPLYVCLLLNINVIYILLSVSYVTKGSFSKRTFLMIKRNILFFAKEDIKVRLHTAILGQSHTGTRSLLFLINDSHLQQQLMFVFLQGGEEAPIITLPRGLGGPIICSFSSDDLISTIWPFPGLNLNFSPVSESAHFSDSRASILGLQFP